MSATPILPHSTLYAWNLTTIAQGATFKYFSTSSGSSGCAPSPAPTIQTIIESCSPFSSTGLLIQRGPNPFTIGCLDTGTSSDRPNCSCPPNVTENSDCFPILASRQRHENVSSSESLSVRNPYFG